MAKMQGAEDEGAGSVLKYMTKPESDSNEADWLLWHTAGMNLFDGVFYKLGWVDFWFLRDELLLVEEGA